MVQMAINPLTTEVIAMNSESVEALIRLMREKIRQYDGVQPSSINTTTSYIDYGGGSIDKRAILLVVWPNTRLGDSNLSMLEQIVRDINAPEAVTTRRDIYDRPTRPRKYHSLLDHKCTTVEGYLFSENPRENIGTWVARRFRSAPESIRIIRKERGRWLYSGDTFVEARLNARKLTNLAALEYVVRASRCLAGKNPVEQKALIYDLYRSLLQMSIERKKSENLAGLDEIIEFMKWNMFGGTAIPAGRAYGLRNRSVLLAGVYGVGKTSIAQVLATEDSGTLFVPIESSVLLGALGENRDAFNSLFGSVGKLQRRTGIDVTLFCEDLESATMDQGESRDPDYAAKISSLLNEMQGIGGRNTTISGSANNPAVIDRRFLQFGRISYVVHIPLPNEQQRRRTFEIYMARQPFEGISFDTLVKRTDGFNNRAIEELCYQAAQASLRRASIQIKRSGESDYRAAQRVDPSTRDKFKINEADMNAAYEIVRSQTDVDDLVRLDREIGKFCRKYNTKIGF